MKKPIYALFIVLALTALIVTPVLAGYAISPKIIVGQNIEDGMYAGVVKITGNADGSLTFVFMVKGAQGFCLTDAAIHTGLSLDDFPQNNGGAIPGQFDHQLDFNGCIAKYTYTIQDPAGEHGDNVYIAIHVNAILPDGTQETGWVVRCGDLWGAQFPGNNWSAWIMFPEVAWY